MTSQTATADTTTETGEAAAALANGDARDVAKLLCKRMGWEQWGNPCVTATAYDIDGGEVIVTSGTGEGTFAYDPDAVAAWLDSVDWDAVEAQDDDPESDHDGRRGSYTDFCERCDPTADRAVALYMLIAHDISIDEAGSCMPVLREEVEVIRAAIAAR